MTYLNAVVMGWEKRREWETLQTHPQLCKPTVLSKVMNLVTSLTYLCGCRRCRTRTICTSAVNCAHLLTFSWFRFRDTTTQPRAEPLNQLAYRRSMDISDLNVIIRQSILFVAATGLEPVTLRLWPSRATNCSKPRYCSQSGTRTRMPRMKISYPNQLDEPTIIWNDSTRTSDLLGSRRANQLRYISYCGKWRIRTYDLRIKAIHFVNWLIEDNLRSKLL